MKWNKKGKIFTAAGQHGWMFSHTQVPTALVFSDHIRVFFSTRAEDGMSRATFIDLDIEDPSQVLYLHNTPILELGEAGTFDEHGIIPNHVFRYDEKVYLFYVGWSRRQSVPYSNWMGMAVSDDDGFSFRKYAKGPILDRTPDEIYSATGLICVQHQGKWHGWYATGTQWLSINNRYEHTYELRACQSDNLINWTRPNRPIFPNRLPNESSTRPTVILLKNRWHMWFCYRGTEDFRDGNDSYRIGYAWSKDLSNWTRQDDNAGIDVSSEGWDSTMIAYPCVIPVRDQVLMFYSGNGFGRAGFGYAELETSTE
jgi:predicted GH43/DUF377 family glycosyl hydrolase